MNGKIRIAKGAALIAAMCLLLSACGNRTGGQTEASSGSAGGASTEISAGMQDTDGSEQGGVQKDESKYRVGGSLSGAYVNPDDYTVAQEDLKATGFEYDRESLTYELVWADEFDYEGLPDPDKWGYDIGGSGWGNHELQYYTEGDNVTVHDGVMTIEARKESVGGREYTSTRLVSREKGDWLYCKIEVSAKLPSGLGTWPAIWMLPTDWAYGEWPASGEVDIMEHVGYDQDVIVQSVHNQKFYGGNSKSGSLKVEGVSDEFHTYAVEWLPDCLIFSVDGVETYSYSPGKYTAKPTEEYWPFDNRMHLLINLAFGGDWGGAMGTDDSYFPVQMQVDYVRVYQSPEIMELTGQTEIFAD